MVFHFLFYLITTRPLQVRHALSSSSDIRIEEGDVIKSDAYDAVMALVDDPEVYEEEFITGLMKFYNQ